MVTAIILLVNGIVCFLAALFMLRVIAINWDEKPHMLRVFQYGYTGVLFIICSHHLFRFYSFKCGIPISPKFDLIYYAADWIIALLVIPYFFHQRQKNHAAKNKRIYSQRLRGLH